VYGTLSCVSNNNCLQNPFRSFYDSEEETKTVAPPQSSEEEPEEEGEFWPASRMPFYSEYLPIYQELEFE
jgi:hypothetical protein